MSTVLLLITDNRDVIEHVIHLDGDVVRVPTVGAARRWLAEQAQMAWPDRVGMVAWGPDVVRYAEDGMRLTGPALAGVPQAAVSVVEGSVSLSGYGMVALGLERILRFPGVVAQLNEELWGAEQQEAA